MTDKSELRRGSIRSSQYLKRFRVKEMSTPFYLYDGDSATSVLGDLLMLLKDCIPRHSATVYLPVFANPCLPLLDVLVSACPDVGLLVNSIPELAAARAFKWKRRPVMAFAGGILSEEQAIRVVREADVYYAASVRNLKVALAVENARAKSGLRIDLSDSGELRGIPAHEVRAFFSTRPEIAAHVENIHAYQGPNSPDFDTSLAYGEALVEHCSLFPKLKEINFSGGWPYDYKRGASVMPSHDDSLCSYLENLNRIVTSHGSEAVQCIAFEPGKYLLANHGYFFCRIIECQDTGTRQADIHVDASFVNLPSLKMKNRQQAVTVLQESWIPRTGPTLLCRLHGASGLSTDFLMPGRVALPAPRAGDLIVIHDLGVYGWAGSYNFLGFQKPAEYLAASNAVRKVRERQSESHLLHDLLGQADCVADAHPTAERET